MTPARIISFIGMVLIALFLPLWSFVLAALVYAFIFGPYELLILAVCIDAEFGDIATGAWYFYTLSAVGILISMVYIKPYIRF